MNAQTKHVAIDRPETGKGDIHLFAESELKQSLARTREKMNVPFSGPQTLLLGEVAGRFDPPRRSPWEEESPPAGPSQLRRLLATLGRRLRPQSRPYYLSEHLCRDIGLDWIPPEPPPRFWPW